MDTVTTPDGVTIFFKDWGPKEAQPLVFHHGWPLTADDWDTQMIYFLLQGFRVIAHDRRGHGRSTQVGDGHDMDHYVDLPAGPFYGFNRPGVEPSQPIIQNWWRQGMMGGAKAHYDGIKAFSETDFTEDLQSIDVPTLVMHGTDDQIVPYADSAPLSAKLLKNGTLKSYDGFPHGMCTTHADVINPDLLAFIKG
jgi:pimeloyl-ACP methyl ester carboxylesterase